MLSPKLTGFGRCFAFDLTNHLGRNVGPFLERWCQFAMRLDGQTQGAIFVNPPPALLWRWPVDSPSLLSGQHETIL